MRPLPANRYGRSAFRLGDALASTTCWRLPPNDRRARVVQAQARALAQEYVFDALLWLEISQLLGWRSGIGTWMMGRPKISLRRPVFRWMRWLCALLIAAATLSPLSASAQLAAITIQNVNMRAGPDRGFPVVTWIPGGTPVNAPALGQPLAGQHPPFAIGSQLSAKRSFAKPKKPPASSQMPFSSG